MADFVFNIAKGAAAEKIRDSAAAVGVLILRSAGLESDALMKDRATIATVVANSVEAANGGYARKTGISGTLNVDTVNDRVDADFPDQTWVAVAAGDLWAKLIVFYDEAGTDATRIPLTAHDFVVTPDGSDIVAQLNAAGFYRAA